MDLDLQPWPSSLLVVIACNLLTGYRDAKGWACQEAGGPVVMAPELWYQAAERPTAEPLVLSMEEGVGMLPEALETAVAAAEGPAVWVALLGDFHVKLAAAGAIVPEAGPLADELAQDPAAGSAVGVTLRYRGGMLHVLNHYAYGDDGLPQWLDDAPAFPVEAPRDVTDQLGRVLVGAG